MSRNVATKRWWLAIAVVVAAAPAANPVSADQAAAQYT